MVKRQGVAASPTAWPRLSVSFGGLGLAWAWGGACAVGTRGGVAHLLRGLLLLCPVGLVSAPRSLFLTTLPCSETARLDGHSEQTGVGGQRVSVPTPMSLPSLALPPPAQGPDSAILLRASLS